MAAFVSVLGVVGRSRDVVVGVMTSPNVPAGKRASLSRAKTQRASVKSEKRRTETTTPRRLRSRAKAPAVKQPSVKENDVRELETSDTPVAEVSMDSSLMAYLKEIGSVNMLGGDEVVECSKSVQKLVVWEDLKNEMSVELGRELTMVEWANELGMPKARFVKELVRLRNAKERLIAGNLRLVVSIAKRYVSSSGLSMLDLIQEGSLGLIRGAERYDASKGFRFATYVSWWIRQAVYRAANESSRQIRLPSHLGSTARKVYRLRKELYMKHMREPTHEEIAKELDISVRRLKFVLEKDKETETVSLDKPFRGTSGEEVSLSDFIMDDRLLPDENVTQNLLRDDLESVLSMLTDTEKQVMRMRYGFDDGFMKNHEQIANIYQVESVKIRKIEARALRKLRHPNLNRCLKEYVQY